MGRSERGWDEVRLQYMQNGPRATAPTRTPHQTKKEAEGLGFERPWSALRGSSGPPRQAFSGKLYNSNVLLYDTWTLSLWSQVAQGAITGSLAGTPLELLPSREIGIPLEQQDVRHTTWESWRGRYPDTLVLAREGQVYPEDGRARDYDRDPYGRMPRRVVGSYDYHEEGTPLIFEPEHRPADGRLDDKARVLGVYFGDGHYKAYPLKAVKEAGGEVTDTVNGRTVTVRHENEQSGTVTDADGRPVRAVHAYWFAWYAFHPETELFWPEGR